MKKNSSFQKFENALTSAIIKTHKPLIWLECFDYGFVMDLLEKLTTTIVNNDKDGDIRLWNKANMNETDLQGKKPRCYKNNNKMELTLGDCVVKFTKSKDKLLVARISEDIFQNDRTSKKYSTRNLIPALQEFVYKNSKGEIRRKTILLIASNHFEITGLEHICEHLVLPLPDKDDIQNMLGYFLIKDEKGVVVGIEGEGNKQYPFAPDMSRHYTPEFADRYEELINALYGMHMYDIKELLHTIKSESDDHEIPYGFKGGKNLPIRIKEVKKQMVKNSGLLEVIDYKENIDKEIEDIDNLREHLEMERDLMNNPVFLKSKLPNPKGILLVGAPGCGKSTAAKAAASILKLDLYRLNIGDLLGHKYGQSENQFSEALRTADASAPCVLWIDEIEKAFAGAGNTQNNDDTLTHIVGRFLTWMQEHKTLVYLVATANDISDLKPEMKRKGRWDEIFYLEYPSKEGRKKIFDVLLKKYDLNEKNFPIGLASKCIEEKEGISGAEIEGFVISIARHFLLNKDEKNIKEIIDNKLEHGADLKTFNDYRETKIQAYKEAKYKPASKFHDKIEK